MTFPHTLFAVSDTLVFKALETMGKRLVKTDRSRFKMLGRQPVHVAHTLWQVDDREVAKALRGAWDILPDLMDRHPEGCEFTSDQLILVLNTYVHDLVITGTPHSLADLEYRFISKLGVEHGD